MSIASILAYSYTITRGRREEEYTKMLFQGLLSCDCWIKIDTRAAPGAPPPMSFSLDDVRRLQQVLIINVTNFPISLPGSVFDSGHFHCDEIMFSAIVYYYYSLRNHNL